MLKIASKFGHPDYFRAVPFQFLSGCASFGRRDFRLETSVPDAPHRRVCLWDILRSEGTGTHIPTIAMRGGI
jgi:hypothetical protein